MAIYVYGSFCNVLRRDTSLCVFIIPSIMTYFSKQNNQKKVIARKIIYIYILLL